MSSCLKDWRKHGKTQSSIPKQAEEHLDPKQIHFEFLCEPHKHTHTHMHAETSYSSIMYNQTNSVNLVILDQGLSQLPYSPVSVGQLRLKPHALHLIQGLQGGKALLQGGGESYQPQSTIVLALSVSPSLSHTMKCSFTDLADH